MKFSVLVALAALSAPVLALAQEGEMRSKLKDSDLEKVGDKFGEYLKDLMEGKGREDRSLESFQKEWEKVEKRLKGQLTAYPEDLSIILHAAGDWGKPPSLGKAARAGRGMSDSEDLEWYYYAPKKYNPKSDLLPMYFVPYSETAKMSSGGDGRALADEWGSESKIGDEAIVVAAGLGKSPDDWRTNMWRTFAESAFAFRVHHNKIWFVGQDGMAPYVLEFANSFPHRFAAIILRNPTGDPPKELGNLKNVPVFVSGNGEPFAKALEAAGAPVETGENALSKVAEWAMGRTRNPAPTTIEFMPTDQHTKVSYWVRVEPEWILDDKNQLVLTDPEKRPAITVSVDRAKNTITARARKIQQLEILLSDAMVDMDKPIILDVNGKVTELRRERSQQTFVDHFMRTGDRGTIFCASFAMRVPELQEPDAPK